MEDRSARDRDLVRRVLEGDHRSFEELVTAYQNLAAAVAWRHGVRSGEIEDVVSEIFIKVYGNLHRYRPDHAFSTWLYRLAANHALDHGRRRKPERRRIEMPDQVTDPGPGAGEMLEERERALLVRRAMREIPVRYRKTLVLVYVEGRKVHEAAEILGIPTGTVKTRLMRGREALRKVLARRHPDRFGGGRAM